MDPRAQTPHDGLRLAVGAIGVVYGDIGTSPLYTMKEAFGHAYGLAPTDANVLGVLSLVFWSLMLIVTLKYVLLVMRADNRGEGGIMALMALAQRSLPIDARLGYTLGILGIFGAALFFGDAVITPAISTLGAMEGLEVAAPALERYVVPLTIGIMVALFAIQRHGTERIGVLFGPITCLWFLAIAACGVLGILDTPRVLYGLSPAYALAFAVAHGGHAFIVLGAVVLAVTGAEALYADMGHFGKAPIRNAWLWIVFPALVLNYFGQGALLLADPGAVVNPFYRLVPAWGLYPMIVLATAAAIIASQAVISGAFSISRQAIQLGYLPRVKVMHTSETTIGQVFLPSINRFLLVVVVALVLGFGSSSALASAYGVSVTGTMLITTALLHVVVQRRWGWSGPGVSALFALLYAIDVAFFASNVIKIADGAWFPLVLGLVVFTLMRTWRRGRLLLVEETRRDAMKVGEFVASLMASPPARVSGTAVFLSASNDRVPLALLHNLKHNKVLHERNVLLTVETANEPRVDNAERVVHTGLGNGFHRLTLRFGFMEDPDVPKTMLDCAAHGLAFDMTDTTFFANRETIVARADKGMPLWRDKLFVVMMKNTVSATEFFRIPGNRLVELGTHVEI